MPLCCGPSAERAEWYEAGSESATTMMTPQATRGRTSHSGDPMSGSAVNSEDGHSNARSGTRTRGRDDESDRASHTPMTAEQRANRLERKKAMRAALRELTKDARQHRESPGLEHLRLRRERMKLAVAAMAVRQGKFGRRGPAEGSTVPPTLTRELILRQHASLGSIEPSLLRAAAGGWDGASPLALSNRQDSMPSSPTLQPPMVRRWTSEGSGLAQHPQPWASPGKGSIIHPHHSPFAAPALDEANSWREANAAEDHGWREVTSAGDDAVTEVEVSRATTKGAGDTPSAAAGPKASVTFASSAPASSSLAPSPISPNRGSSTSDALRPSDVEPMVTESASATTPGTSATVSVAADVATTPTPTGTAAAAGDDEEPEVVVADDAVLVAMTSMARDWKCVETRNLDKYLKHIGGESWTGVLSLSFSLSLSFPLTRVSPSPPHSALVLSFMGEAQTCLCLLARALVQGRTRRRASVPYVHTHWRPPRTLPARRRNRRQGSCRRQPVHQAQLLGRRHADDHRPRPDRQEARLCRQAQSACEWTVRANQ